MDQLKLMEDLPTRNTYRDFEQHLRKNCKQILPVVVVDDRTMKVSTIDLSMASLKAKYGDLLTTAIVDYVNQLTLEGVKQLDKLDWKVQMHLATMLKNNIARKYKVLVMSPYQVDETGATRL
ncbi:hypothetical protein IACHDJAJ_00079 [Aeromonas phage vB_AdhS_TS3]|nr:hypothetical protein IACHDJAJ_00079 [Aeromonas phage vB_AdhS_TS3]